MWWTTAWPRITASVFHTRRPSPCHGISLYQAALKLQWVQTYSRWLSALPLTRPKHGSGISGNKYLQCTWAQKTSVKRHRLLTCTRDIITVGYSSVWICWELRLQPCEQKKLRGEHRYQSQIFDLKSRFPALRFNWNKQAVTLVSDRYRDWAFPQPYSRRTHRALKCLIDYLLLQYFSTRWQEITDGNLCLWDSRNSLNNWPPIKRSSREVVQCYY